MRKIITTILMISSCHLHGAFKGKVDVGPAYIHLDSIQKGKTVSKSDLGAVRADLSIYTEDGWGMKSSVLQSVWDIDHTDEDVTSLQFAFGHLWPVTDKLMLFPQAGISWSSITTDLTIPIQFGPGFFQPVNFERTSKSAGYFVGLEACYSFVSCFRFCGQFLWGWTDIDSTLSPRKVEGNDICLKSSGQGPIFSGILEYDINHCWSVNIGGALNLSWDDESNGLRAWGGKLGIAYWW